MLHDTKSVEKSPLAKRKTGDTKKAFTLLELLAGMAVLVVLVYFLGQMLNHTSKAWTLGKARTERMQNVRSIGDFIGGELRTALLPIDRGNTNNLQFVVNPAGISDEFKNRDAIFWQTPLASDAALGDVAEIGYFVRWDDSHPNNPHANLCRFFVNPVVRDESGAAQANTKFLIYSNSQWLSDSLLLENCPADKANDYQGLFAENVLGLWVTCVDSKGMPITADASASSFTGNSFDSRRGFTDSTGTVQPACSLPVAVDLGFALVDVTAAGKIGPSERDLLKSLASASINSTEFGRKVAANPSLRLIYPGLRCLQTRIYLQNSR